MPDFEEFHPIQAHGNERSRLARIFIGTVRLSSGAWHHGICIEFAKDHERRPYTTALDPDDADKIAAMLTRAAVRERRRRADGEKGFK